MRIESGRFLGAAMLAWVLVVTATAQAQDVNARYPNRVPDWLWTQEQFTPFISPEDRKAIETKVEALKALGDTDEKKTEELEKEIAKDIAGKLALRDLAYGAPLAEFKADGLKLAVQFDPEFSQEQRLILLQAAELFLSAALNEEVIRRAIEASVDEPSPFPEKLVLGRVDIDLASAEAFAVG